MLKIKYNFKKYDGFCLKYCLIFAEDVACARTIFIWAIFFGENL